MEFLPLRQLPVVPPHPKAHRARPPTNLPHLSSSPVLASASNRPKGFDPPPTTTTAARKGKRGKRPKRSDDGDEDDGEEEGEEETTIPEVVTNGMMRRMGLSVRNHEVAIAELKNLSSSRPVYQKCGNIYFRRDTKDAMASEQEKLESAKAQLQKQSTT